MDKRHETSSIILRFLYDIREEWRRQRPYQREENEILKDDGTRVINIKDSQGYSAVVTVSNPDRKKFKPVYEEDKTIRIALRTKSKTLTFYDQKVWSDVEGISDEGPRIYGFDYDFYLSPNEKALFITRHIGSGLNVAYLYRQSEPGKLISVFPNGYRFDEAAFRHFARRTGIGAEVISRHSTGVFDLQITRFEGWDKKSRVLYFQLVGGEKRKEGVDWHGYYDLDTGRFGFAQQPEKPSVTKKLK